VTINTSAGERKVNLMRRFIVIATFAMVLGIGPAVARADQPPTDLAGQPFYFSATCTGLGDVVLVNQSLARTAALHVLGSNTVVIATFGSIGGARGTENESNGSCTFTGGGFSPDTIEPFDEPFTTPVVIR
jgi:hypothetical protein